MVLENEMIPVHLIYDFHVAPDKLFAAWVKTEQIRKWLFVGNTSEIVKVEMNLEVGGSFSILEREKTTGAYIDHFGEFLEINDPTRLLFSLSVPKHFTGKTLVTLEIEPTPSGSQLTFIQTGVPKEKTEKNWQDMFKHLRSILEEGTDNLHSHHRKKLFPQKN